MTDRVDSDGAKAIMNEINNGRTVMDSFYNKSTQHLIVDRLKHLYPMVNEEETPLPRSWSPKDKYNYIGLSQNNLRVHYKGKPFNNPDLSTNDCHFSTYSSD